MVEEETIVMTPCRVVGRDKVPWFYDVRQDVIVKRWWIIPRTCPQDILSNSWAKVEVDRRA